MRIGILGTGGMAATLGGAWAAAGHEVLIGGRDPASAARAARSATAAAAGTAAGAALAGAAGAASAGAASAGAALAGAADVAVAGAVDVAADIAVAGAVDVAVAGAVAGAVGGAVGGRVAGAGGRAGAVGHGSLADAARFGAAVLVAVPAAAAAAVVGGVAGHLAGRVVVDCTNPVAPGADGPMLTAPVAPRLAAAAPDAAVAKAFNLCHVSVWSLRPPVYETRPLVVPFCADPPAVATVTDLVASIGCVPAHCGGLTRAAYLEATAALAIGMWFAGAQPRWAFPAPAGA